MFWRRSFNVLIVSSLLVFGGCASVSLNAGFSEISASVEERSGARVYWHGGTDLDKEAAAKVQGLLKETLDPDRAVQVALLNNRDLQAVYSDLGVAQADLVQAGLLNNPIFDAAVRFPTAGGGPANLELSAVMNFLDVFFMPLRKRVAAARFEEAKIRVTGAVLNLAARVKSNYYVNLANEQMVELRQTILRSLTASLEISRRLLDAGNISELDFARERAVTEAGKLALRSAELAARRSREELNVLMGLWGRDTVWEVEKRLAELPEQELTVEGIETVALSKSLDLLHAKQRIIGAGEELGYSRTTALIPELHAGPLGEREEGGWQVGPVIEFPIPLFDQGQARIARAVADLRRAQQAYYALAVRIRATARAARDRLEGTRDRALYYRDILLPLHERIVNEAQLHYNAMQLGPVQLLRAREQQIEAGAAYVDALREYWLARAEVEQILSGSLPSLNGIQVSPAAGALKLAEREGH